MKLVELCSHPSQLVRWRHVSGSCVAIITKVTYRLASPTSRVHDEQLPLLARDQHFNRDPNKGVYAPADLAPGKARPEVVVVGAGTGTGPGRVRVGGVDKQAAQVGTVGLGPIAASWPARQKRIPHGWDGTLEKLPSVTLADDDLLFFNAAPPDQQLAAFPWRNGLRIELEHLVGKGGRWQSVLPKERPVAFCEKDGTRVELVADTLWIDVDRALASVTFRGRTAVADTRVVVTTENPDQPLKWRAVAAQLGAGASSVSATVDVEALGLVSSDVALPFIDEQRDKTMSGWKAPAQPAPPAPPPPSPPARPATPPVSPRRSPPTTSPQSPRGDSPWSDGVSRSATFRAPVSAVPPTATSPKMVSRPANVKTATNPGKPPSALSLLWMQSDCALRLRLIAPFKAIIEELEDRPVDFLLEPPDGIDVDAWREVFEVVVRGRAGDYAHTQTALSEAVRSDGKFAAPLVLLQAEMSTPADPRAAVEAWMSLALPLTPDDESELARTMAAARRTLDEGGDLCPDAVWNGLRERLEDGLETLVGDDVDEMRNQVQQALIHGRRYQHRAVFGEERVRALVHLPGIGTAVPTYLPQPLAARLPLEHRHHIRVLADAHHRIDVYERSEIALAVVALAIRPGEHAPAPPTELRTSA